MAVRLFCKQEVAGSSPAGGSLLHMKATKTQSVDGYNGYKNYETWYLAHCIQNDEALYNLCKNLYDDGYKFGGTILNKLREYGTHWKSIYTGANGIDLRKDELCNAEITRVLHDLYSPNAKRTTKPKNP